MREFGIRKKLIELTRLTLTNVRGQTKAAGSVSGSFNVNKDLRQGDAALLRVLFQLALGKVIRDADVNIRAIIFFKCTQLLAYAHDIDIMGRTTQESTFIQIEQAARDLVVRQRRKRKNE